MTITLYSLTKARFENDGIRNAFYFWLTPNKEFIAGSSHENFIPHNRIIPREVKQYVMFRDSGRGVVCSSAKNIQFDHIIPFSQGGTSCTKVPSLRRVGF